MAPQRQPHVKHEWGFNGARQSDLIDIDVIAATEHIYYPPRASILVSLIANTPSVSERPHLLPTFCLQFPQDIR